MTMTVGTANRLSKRLSKCFEQMFMLILYCKGCQTITSKREHLCSANAFDINHAVSS